MYRFNANAVQTLIVMGMLKEGYDNANISVVGFSKRATSVSEFQQVVGRAMRVDRKIKTGDPITACVVSQPDYVSQKYFDDVLSGVAVGED